MCLSHLYTKQAVVNLVYWWLVRQIAGDIFLFVNRFGCKLKEIWIFMQTCWEIYPKLKPGSRLLVVQVGRPSWTNNKPSGRPATDQLWVCNNSFRQARNHLACCFLNWVSQQGVAINQANLLNRTNKQVNVNQATLPWFHCQSEIWLFIHCFWTRVHMRSEIMPKSLAQNGVCLFDFSSKLTLLCRLIEPSEH